MKRKEICRVEVKDPQKKPRKLNSGTAWYWGQNKTAEEYAAHSVCSFTLEIPKSRIDASIIDLDVVNNQHVFVARSFIINILLRFDKKIVDELPIDCEEDILCQFSICSVTSVNLTIYGYQKQLHYLTEQVKFAKLTSNLTVYLTERLEKCSFKKKKRNQLGFYIDESKNDTFDTCDFFSPILPLLTTKLTNFQEISILKTFELLKVPIFSFIGSLLRTENEYAAFSTKFRFLKRIDDELFLAWQNNCGAILSTDSGTGKTLMTIAISLLQALKKKKINLIVVKQELIPHWKSEVKKHVAEMYQGSFLFMEDDEDYQKFSYEVSTIIASVNIIKKLKHEKFDIIFFEEAHCFSRYSEYHSSIATLQSCMRICITATPEKNLDAIISLFGFEDVENFVQSMDIYSTLSDYEALRRMKTLFVSNAKDIILDSLIMRGKRKEIGVAPIYRHLNTPPEHLAIFNLVTNYTYCSTNIAKVFHLLSNLDTIDEFNKQVLIALLKNQKELIIPFQSQSEKLAFSLSIDNCNICLGNFENPVQLSVCQHVFCQQCLSQWFNIKGVQFACPVCRKDFEDCFLPRFPDQLTPLKKKQKDFLQPEKGDFVFGFLKNLKKDSQTIVYTQYAENALLYQSWTKEFNISAQLAGFHLAKRKSRINIEEFKKKKINVLILDILHFSEGIDFPDVSKLLVTGFSCPNQLKQAMHRVGCSRLGSKLTTKETLVTVVTYAKSVESWLLTHQFSQNSTTIKKITREQLLNLDYFLNCDSDSSKMSSLKKCANDLKSSVQFQVVCKKTQSPQKFACIRKNKQKYVFSLDKEQIYLVRVNRKAIEPLLLEDLMKTQDWHKTLQTKKSQAKIK